MTPGHDVLVVGAGPAGSVAALVLARAGARVRLIDRATFPRDKLCGDTLNPGALALVERIVRAPAALNGLALRGMIVTGPAGARVEARYSHGLAGLAITRRALDAWLLEEASAAGAEFEPGLAALAPVLGEDGRVAGVRVAVCGRSERRGEFDLRARIVVLAEGRPARLARALGLSCFAASPKRWAFGAYFADVEDLIDFGEMHVRADGYVGVAPVPGGLANVCVVREAGASARTAGGLTAAGVIDRAIDSDLLLRDRFVRARRVSPPVTLGPLAVESRAAGCPGLLLAGDAAGFIDPMTGDGLRFAIRGGELAAEAALEETASGRPAYARLAAARAAEFAGKWRLNRALRSLVGSPRAVGLAANVASRWPAPLRYLIGVAGDVPVALRARAT